ncbi:MAG TPA: hypothetical protein VEX13_02835 [Chloroflexia bacterium]|nr:hypothetical protein [Chloroflexia bacterium]
MAAAVKIGLHYVKLLELSKGNIGAYFPRQELTWRDNGMPSFRASRTLLDFAGLLSRSLHSPIHSPVAELFEPLLDYLRARPGLQTYFGVCSAGSGQTGRTLAVEAADALGNKYFDMAVTLQIARLVDRYIHEYGTTEFSKKRFSDIYSTFFASSLFGGPIFAFPGLMRVELVVPILLLKFDFDVLRIGEDARIECMDEKFQLERVSERLFGHNKHSLPMEAATHALVLTDWERGNSDQDQVRAAYGTCEHALHITEQVDRFFLSLIIAAGYSTGYAQLLLRPCGWARTPAANFPPIDGILLERYPAWFVQALDHEVRLITLEEATAVGAIFARLREVKEPRLLMACRRLRRCMFLEPEPDTALDVVVAMEALLTDGDPETWEKVALRMASLATLDTIEEHNPVQVLQIMQRIYKYRTDVMRGSGVDHRMSTVKVGDIEVTVLGQGLDYLRMALRVLLEHPQYLELRELDRAFLLDDVS